MCHRRQSHYARVVRDDKLRRGPEGGRHKRRRRGGVHGVRRGKEIARGAEMTSVFKEEWSVSRGTVHRVIVGEFVKW